VEAGDPDIVAAARREVGEETAVELDQEAVPALVGIDVHQIPASEGEPAHVHHDLVFAFMARSDGVTSADALRVAWCPWDRLDDFAADPPVRRAAERARAVFRAGGARTSAPRQVAAGR
jgi:ADP-ribose pyrophosphatase YjhB (NUDIX family)